jgi:uncharacterized protein
MKYGFIGRLTGVLVLAVFLLLMGGCGYKNQPVPPASVVPKAITDLLYKLDENGVHLRWSYPVKTIRGSAIDDISSFELYRAEIPIEDYCANCPIPFGEPLELDGGSPIDGKVRRKASYDSSLLKAGYKYFFKVRSRTSWWAASKDSNIITFVWSQPALAPVGVTATAGDGQVSLQWQPVTTFADGSAVSNDIKYQVRRSTGGSTFEKLGEPVSATNYVDRQVLNGLRYFYTIQSITAINDDVVRGGISKTVAAIPMDLTPPLPPLGVTAVRTGVGIKIYWDKSDAADVNGYRVYRRAANKDSYQFLGEVAPEYTLFVDSKAGDKVRYYYAVTAIDLATPPNESEKSKEATVRY